jgi:hypothetical protein
LDLTRLPLSVATENLAMLLNASGSVMLENTLEHYASTVPCSVTDPSLAGTLGVESEVCWQLSWNREDFPHVLLWISNRGRPYFPWVRRSAESL